MYTSPFTYHRLCIRHRLHLPPPVYTSPPSLNTACVYVTPFTYHRLCIRQPLHLPPPVYTSPLHLPLPVYTSPPSLTTSCVHVIPFTYHSLCIYMSSPTVHAYLHVYPRRHIHHRLCVDHPLHSTFNIVWVYLTPYIPHSQWSVYSSAPTLHIHRRLCISHPVKLSAEANLSRVESSALIPSALPRPLLVPPPLPPRPRPPRFPPPPP